MSLSQGDTAVHHISDVDIWGGHPDKNYYVYVVLAFLGGLVGADHFYLRSYDTAAKKALLNVFGLGLWYFWDLIQIMKDGDQIVKHGLSSPFDWIRGIGRGVFVMPQEGGGSKKNEPKYAAPKSYVIYTILALCLGFLGADKFYIGETMQGIAKIFSVFNIVTFLFGIAWVVWDAFHAFFMTDSILTEGITAPLPFSWFFKAPVGGCQLFQVQEVKPTEPARGWFDFTGVLPTPGALYKELVVPLLQPTVGTALQQADKALMVGTQMAALGNKALQQGPQLAIDTMTGIVEEGQRAVNEAVNEAAQGAVQGIIPKQLQVPRQAGGGSALSGGPTPVIAGAITALLIAGGVKGVFDYLGSR
jgi:TM2 domain-containing membrane protein YozV